MLNAQIRNTKIRRVEFLPSGNSSFLLFSPQAHLCTTGNLEFPPPLFLSHILSQLATEKSVERAMFPSCHLCLSTSYSLCMAPIKCHPLNNLSQKSEVTFILFKPKLLVGGVFIWLLMHELQNYTFYIHLHISC